MARSFRRAPLACSVRFAHPVSVILEENPGSGTLCEGDKRGFTSNILIARCARSRVGFLSERRNFQSGMNTIIGGAQRSRAKESRTRAQRAERAVKIEVSDCVDAALTLTLSLDRERDREMDTDTDTESEIHRLSE